MTDVCFGLQGLAKFLRLECKAGQGQVNFIIGRAILAASSVLEGVLHE